MPGPINITPSSQGKIKLARLSWPARLLVGVFLLLLLANLVLTCLTH
jgi:hypothetical protein